MFSHEADHKIETNQNKDHTQPHGQCRFVAGSYCRFGHIPAIDAALDFRPDSGCESIADVNFYLPYSEP
jgi:hypothetical protein